MAKGAEREAPTPTFSTKQTDPATGLAQLPAGFFWRVSKAGPSEERHGAYMVRMVENADYTGTLEWDSATAFFNTKEELKGATFEALERLVQEQEEDAARERLTKELVGDYGRQKKPTLLQTLRAGWKKRQARKQAQAARRAEQEKAQGAKKKQDETEYLLGSKANAAHLKSSIEQLSEGRESNASGTASPRS